MSAIKPGMISQESNGARKRFIVPMSDCIMAMFLSNGAKHFLVTEGVPDDALLVDVRHDYGTGVFYFYFETESPDISELQEVLPIAHTFTQCDGCKGEMPKYETEQAEAAK